MKSLIRLSTSTPAVIRWRAYSTPIPKRSLRGKGHLLSLDHFLQQKKTLALWREIVRAINKIPVSSTRDELHEFARDEFERHRDVTDIKHIRYLNSTGKTQFDSMKRYIDEQAR